MIQETTKCNKESQDNVPFHFGIRNSVLSAKISHAKGCVCKINKSNFKIAEY